MPKVESTPRGMPYCIAFMVGDDVLPCGQPTQAARGRGSLSHPTYVNIADGTKVDYLWTKGGEMGGKVNSGFYHNSFEAQESLVQG